MATFYSSKNGKVRVGTAGSSSPSTTVTVKRWDVTPRNSPANTTNSESAGYEESYPTISGLDVSIELDDDGTGNIFDLGIKAGQYISVKLYLNGTSGPFWLIPYLYIESPNQQADPNSGAMMADRITGRSSGAFSYPTGNAVS
jgi:hypothetical protein